MPSLPMLPPQHKPAWNGRQPASDSWTELTRFTDARIALGRAGASWRTETLLAFRLAHAQARDAVCRAFAPEAVEQPLRQLGYQTMRLSTGTNSRDVFRKRPDLGRVLSAESARLLARHAADWPQRHLAVVVSDGLSALAAETQTAPLLADLLPLLGQAGWTICPIFVVPCARVKLQDEIGELLGVRHALALLGERPGLGSPDSLGAYFTCQPRRDKTDADRNCVSNIRPQGLPPAEAAKKLAQLLFRSEEQHCSGVRLKETETARVIE
jgi:ethanolamine ammonia-lyase small subunit